MFVYMHVPYITMYRNAYICLHDLFALKRRVVTDASVAVYRKGEEGNAQSYTGNCLPVVCTPIKTNGRRLNSE